MSHVSHGSDHERRLGSWRGAAVQPSAPLGAPTGAGGLVGIRAALVNELHTPLPWLSLYISCGWSRFSWFRGSQRDLGPSISRLCCDGGGILFRSMHVSFSQAGLRG